MRLSTEIGVVGFEYRADEPELMDGPCTYEEFRACLRDLAQINEVTFGYRPTLKWLERLVFPQERAVHIVDVGSGRADMLRKVAQWASRRRIEVKLTAIDLNPFAEKAGREAARSGERIEWFTGDAFSYQPDQPIDVAISSLFAHHLDDAQLVEFLRWMEENAGLGWFVNDLHRERVPFHLFRVLARLFGWHAFVQHDGPLSIRRSFRPEDWQRYMRQAGLDESSVKLEAFRPGRLCVGRIKLGRIK